MRQVQFSLAEKKTNPENVEKRRSPNAVQSQSGTGSGVGGTAGNGGEVSKDQELTGFEATLKKVADWLGSAS